MGWNTVLLCAAAPIIALLIIGLAMGDTGNTQSSPNLTPVFGDGTQKMLSIKLTGVIMGDSADNDNPLGSVSSSNAYGYDIKSKLYAAAKDDTIKGVILEINSPGGTIYGARAIADGVKYYRDTTKRPVYAFISGTGASGAYWAAASTDRIIADPGSDIGSIGVILGPFKYYDKPLSENDGLLSGGVVTQNGIETVTLTAGRSKDVGNPYRKLTADEIKTLQAEVNNDYDTFVAYVAERRHIMPETIHGSIGAMAYGTKTAQQYGLIDQAGNREDAYAQLAKAANITNDYQVVREQTPTGFLATLLSAFTHQPARQAASNSTASAAPAVCQLTQTKLAFYGSLDSLCP